LKPAGIQAEVLWQASHELVVWTWLAGFPVAVVPWQFAQVPGATPAWLKPAGTHARVRWQVSQELVVMMCLEDLPGAVLPLWQEAQVPGVTVTCEKRAPAQVAVERWQLSQGSIVWTWFWGLKLVAMRLPGRWQ
jgi:hypothetical protein